MKPHAGQDIRIVSRSEEETREAAHSLAPSLRAGSLVAFSGDLGTGKTVFVRGLCEYFHCLPQVTSPTFTIVNEYDGDLPIAHCDLYRLHLVEEMLAIGLDDLFNSDRLILVEWAERAFPLLPAERIDVVCAHGETEQERIIRIRHVRPGSAGLLVAGMEGLST